MMNWEARWRILADIINDLYGGDERVPPKIINDLRSAKIMLEILKIDRSHPENINRLEEYMSNVEDYVLSAARSKFGEKYVNDALRRLCKLEAEEIMTETPVRFHPDLPRGERWIRVQITDEITLEHIEKTARGIGLKFRVEKDGYALVYGEDEKVKMFVKRMAEWSREFKRGKTNSPS
jgi:hypothetical protein